MENVELVDQLEPAVSFTRLKSLDFLRGIAVLLVLFTHWGPLPGPLYYIVRAGWTGVNLFFVLSGFLVSGLLFKEYYSTGKVRVWRFLGRRAWKIYPSFYLWLATIVALRHLKGRTLNPLSITAEAFFFQNYYPGLQGHTWSLAVEEHFYILFACYVAFLVAKYQFSPDTEPFAVLPRHLLVLATTLLVVRCLLFVSFEPNPFVHFFPTHLRIDSLFCGVVVGYFYFTPKLRLKLLALTDAHFIFMLVAIFLCWLPAFMLDSSSWFILTIGFIWHAVGSSLLIPCAVSRGYASSSFGNNYFVRVVAWIGLNSYSIYLWHFSVRADGVGLIRSLGGGLWMQFMGYLVGSVVIGYLMALLIERPFLRLRDWLIPKNTSDLSLRSTL